MKSSHRTVLKYNVATCLRRHFYFLYWSMFILNEIQRSFIFCMGTYFMLGIVTQIQFNNAVSFIFCMEGDLTEFLHYYMMPHTKWQYFSGHLFSLLKHGRLELCLSQPLNWHTDKLTLLLLWYRITLYLFCSFMQKAL